jgi:hypothetical protein
MDLKCLSDDELHAKTVSAAEAERMATTHLLHHLIEVRRRRLFSKFDCDSLFSYCLKVLKMSEPQAARRVNAANVLADCPEVEEKINSGALTLTAVSQAQTFFKKEAKAGNEISKPQKTELIQKLETKSCSEVERFLISQSSFPPAPVKESIRLVSETVSELRLPIDTEFRQDLERLKEIWSHEMPDASFLDVLRKSAKLALKHSDPLIRAKRIEQKKELRRRASPPAEPKKPEIQGDEDEKTIQTSRALSAEVKRAVDLRDNGECTYVDKRTGLKCASRHRIQYDHITPFAMGGTTTPENLRLRCLAHNQRHAIDSYGFSKMKRFLRAPRLEY